MVIALAFSWSQAFASSGYGNNDAVLHKQIFDSIIPDPNPIVVYGEPKGSKIEFLRTGDSTCGKYLYALVTVPPGSGPPPHIHHWTDEWFYAPDGGPMMFMGTREYKNINNPPDKGRGRKDTLQLMAMEKGDLMYGPRYKIHGYVNATDKPINVHIIWTPDTPDVSILGYFLFIHQPLFLDDELNSQFNAIQQIKAVSEARKYGMNFSSNFWQYVKDVKYVRPHGDKNLDELMELIRQGDMPCY
jgi:oxalate decarboxylase/phosphoglucose isomerase-like protein (cupin superfamily)